MWSLTKTSQRLCRSPTPSLYANETHCRTVFQCLSRKHQNNDEILLRSFLNLEFGCFYTRGKNTYCSVSSFSWKHIKEAPRLTGRKETEKNGGKTSWDTLLLYCCSLDFPLCIFWALTPSSVTRLLLPPSVGGKQQSRTQHVGAVAWCWVSRHSTCTDWTHL